MLVHQNPSPVKPARVVILGAGGFLAPELARVLDQDGIASRAIGSKVTDLTSECAGDKIAAELERGDVVVMAAALTPEKGRDVGTLMKNLRMAESVCAALCRATPAHFIYISSDGVYDARFSSLLNEESTCEPMELYSLMHIAREKMLAHACRQSPVQFTIVRPCAIYGPGDTHNSYGPNRFVRTACADGRITLFGGGEEKRHHVYVTDVAELIKLCILRRSTGVINAVTGEAISFGELAEKIAAAVCGMVTIERLPRVGPVTHRHFDASALASAFPRFRATPLEAGLAQMIASTSPRR